MIRMIVIIEGKCKEGEIWKGRNKLQEKLTTQL